MNVGETKRLVEKINNWTTGFKRVIWTTSNESVAALSGYGNYSSDGLSSPVNITAKSAGTAVITAVSATDSSVKATCTVTVTAITSTSTTNQTNRGASTVTVTKQTLKWAKNRKGRALAIEWKFDKWDDGYQIEIATNSSYGKIWGEWSNVKKVKIKK